jgi:TrmH family RNA methyltransferase
MKFIKSRDNSSIKHIHKLVKQRKYRNKCGQFVAEGLRTCQDILISNIGVDIFLCSERFYTRNLDLCSRLEGVSEESIVVPDSIFSVLSDTKNPQGVMLVVNTLDKNNDIDKIDYNGKYILLENVQNPDNISTVLRSAEAFAIDGVILTEDCCDIYSPKIVRGSMGAIFRVPFYMVDSASGFIKDIYNNVGTSYAACLSDSSISVDDISFEENSLVVIGNEANGLTEATINACKHKVIIPMKGKIDSLNAGVAASIIMWEMS